MAQNQGLRPNPKDTLKGKDRSGLIGVVVVISVVIIAAGFIAYTPTNFPIKSKTILAAGTYQEEGGSSAVEFFLVYHNMTNIQVHGAFTSRENVYLKIGTFGSAGSHPSRPPDLAPSFVSVFWSSGNTTQRSFSVSLPSPSGSDVSAWYAVDFYDPNPFYNSNHSYDYNELNITHPIVMTYYYSDGYSQSTPILISGENTPLPKTQINNISSNVAIYGSRTISVSYGQSITFSIELYNEGSIAVEEPISSSWPTTRGVVRGPSGNLSPQGQSHYTTCFGIYYPYGFSVFEGIVTNSTLSSVVPLDLVYPGVEFCPEIYVFDNYTIGAQSDSAILTGPNSPFNVTLLSTFTFNGYYAAGSNSTDSSPNQNYQYNYFPQGEYTVVVEDEWGAIAFLHFRVS
ncbi:MAG: hypothetical protein M1556_01130 [Candidatus Thermoplasmatota archaeon]|jgi:hypothetical protein|nr:hypothetical protein [Candidatus Thermoplasmatota archaeon]MCL6002237.1 hypothetical protein [Candidatus Thermoplasmatota archaeon]